MKEDHRSYKRNCKRLSFPNCKSCVSITAMIFFYIILYPAVLVYDFHNYFHKFIRKQFHSVNWTEISHMKKWREPKSLSARLIPVFKHCEYLCIGMYSEEREKHRAAWNNPPYTKLSILKNPIIIILGYLFRFFFKA